MSAFTGSQNLGTVDLQLVPSILNKDEEIWNDVKIDEKRIS